MSAKLDIKVGMEVKLKNQAPTERFIVDEVKANGYLNLLEYALNKEGGVKRTQPKKILLPLEDVLGIQTKMEFH
ncbi:hypothetical protein [Poseidonibacter lekithochrous]|uniref:hypothetical protein n=1 Tax=Poseidonibacter lekithochrous TaxID=1904463 RepID=UPI000D34C978|nr:hypothetical protein [Poseidonibacter lekithochrous]